MTRAAAMLCLVALSAHASSDPLLVWARARAQMENGDFVHAAELATQLCQAQPREIAGFLLRAQILRRAEEFRQAGLALEEAARLDAADPRLLWQRGLLENLLGSPAQALEAFDAIEPRPEQATLHYQRGVALAALQRDDEALQAYSHAVAADSDLFAARYAQYLLLRGRDAAQAATALTEVERLQRELPDWIRNDQLRLEAGELSHIVWPGDEATWTPSGADSLRLTLEPLQAGSSPIGARLELWSAQGCQRARYAQTPMALPVGGVRQVDVLRIEWPDGSVQNLFDVEAGALVVRELLFIKGSWGSVRVREP